MTPNVKRNFIRRFKRIANQFNWKLVNRGKWLRGYKKTDTTCSHSFCPLTAMYYAKTGKRVSTYKADDYDVQLATKVSYNKAWEIIHSADKRVISCDYNESLRKSLLEAVGLRG